MMQRYVLILNPISTSQGWNQPLYERHVTMSGRNRVKLAPCAFYQSFHCSVEYDIQMILFINPFYFLRIYRDAGMSKIVVGQSNRLLPSADWYRVN